MSKWSASEIANLLGARLTGPDLEIAGVSSIKNPKTNTVCFATGPVEPVDLPTPLLVLIGQNASPEGFASVSFIPVDNPRDAYAEVIEHCFQRKRNGISARAAIAVDVVLGDGVCVGDNVTIEEGVVIGKNTYIDHGAVIGWGTQIGSECRIGANVVIGHDGLGSFLDKDRNWRNVRHQGRVVIEDRVEIGPLSAVARGTMDQTLVGAGTHIGPQVNIGHNVLIGNGCLIAGRSHISGSVVVGANSTLWANCIIKDGLRIGENAVIGMGALVQQDVSSRSIVGMLPAISLQKLTRFIHLTKWGK